MISQAIKNISSAAETAGSPCCVMFATVADISPLTVKIDSRFTVPASALILLEGTELMEGDKLVLLRNRSGQRFVILGKAADNAP